MFTTIGRDLKSIWYKLFYVLIPKGSHEDMLYLKNWDLWGYIYKYIYIIINRPLLITLWLAIILGLSSGSNKGSLFV